MQEEQEYMKETQEDLEQERNDVEEGQQDEQFRSGHSDLWILLPVR